MPQLRLPKQTLYAKVNKKKPLTLAFGRPRTRWLDCIKDPFWTSSTQNAVFVEKCGGLIWSCNPQRKPGEEKRTKSIVLCNKICIFSDTNRPNVLTLFLLRNLGKIKNHYLVSVTKSILYPFFIIFLVFFLSLFLTIRFPILIIFNSFLNMIPSFLDTYEAYRSYFPTGSISIRHFLIRILVFAFV